MRKKYFLKLTMLIGLAFVAYSCSPEENEETQPAIKTSNLTTVTTGNLVGEWKLSKMEADSAVDLNNDDTKNTNLLLESSCFDTMDIIFVTDTTFTTHNSKLDFNGGTSRDEFTCAQGRDDFGTWSVSEDMLTLNINVDGTVYTQQKKLTYNSTTFSLEVTKSESDTYVHNDPGNTSASSITILSLEYTKQ